MSTLVAGTRITHEGRTFTVSISTCSMCHGHINIGPRETCPNCSGLGVDAYIDEEVTDA